MIGKIQLYIESNLDNVKLVGMAINRLCLLVLDPAGCDEIELAVVEAVTNCIKHAYPQEPGHEVVVALGIGTRKIQIEIKDRGKPIDPELQKKLGVNFSFDPEDIDALPEGGMGWFLIKSLMDEVTYESVEGTNTLKMDKNIPNA